MSITCLVFSSQSLLLLCGVLSRRTVQCMAVTAGQQAQSLQQVGWFLPCSFRLVGVMFYLLVLV